MGLIYEWQFRREIHGLQWPKLHGRPHVDLAKLLQVMADCRAKILSPPEIEAGIRWFEDVAKRRSGVWDAMEIADLLRLVIGQQQRNTITSWDKNIFKLEEKKDEEDND